MNKNNETELQVFSVEELESRFEMEAIIDDGATDTSDDGKCTCSLEW